ncbi:MAG: hypothetical protein WA919_22745 [Coleofasciculaceae cyanobacterium]
MSKELKRQDFMVVDLTENVRVDTSIPSVNHAALRSGFAGYPANPRWNVTKFRAWRTGCQLREALVQGEMVVRSIDSMLISADEPFLVDEENLPEENIDTNQLQNSEGFSFPFWAKRVLSFNQLA